MYLQLFHFIILVCCPSVMEIMLDHLKVKVWEHAEKLVYHTSFYQNMTCTKYMNTFCYFNNFVLSLSLSLALSLSLSLTWKNLRESSCSKRCFSLNLFLNLDWHISSCLAPFSFLVFNEEFIKCILLMLWAWNEIILFWWKNISI